MSWVEPFAEVGKIILVIAFAIWNFIMWGSNIVAEKAGEGSRILYFIIVFVMIPFLIISWTYAKSQATMEDSQAFITRVFFRMLVVGLIVFAILFILSQM